MSDAAPPAPETDRTTASTIVFLHSGYSVDVEMTKYVAAGFAALGYGLEAFNVKDAAVAGKLGSYLNAHMSEVFCFLSMGYYGAEIKAGDALLHRATGIPLVFYLMDHPLYFAQKPEYEGAIVFVAGADLIDFVTKYYPAGTIAVDNHAFIPPPFDRRAPDFDEFSRRRNEILCPMNLAIWGRPMDAVWARIDEVPEAPQRFVKLVIEAALTDCLTPIHVIAERIASEYDLQDVQIGYVRLALDYVKVWRRNRMVRELIDLPLLVGSDYVPPDLQSKYPEKFRKLSIGDTLGLYRQFRFVLNSFPLMTYALHDRLINAMWANSVLVTDENNAVRKIYTDCVDAIFYDYSDADIAEKVGRFIDDPEAAFELTVKSDELLTVKAVFESATYANLIEAVNEQRRRVALATARPLITPHQQDA